MLVYLYYLCMQVTDKQCHLVPRQVCTTAHSSHCKAVPNKVCREVKDRKCWKTPKQDCKEQKVEVRTRVYRQFFNVFKSNIF